MFSGLCTYLVFLIFGLFGVNAYLHSQTTDPVILEMGQSYLGICTVWSFGIIMYTIYEKLLQATGRTTLTTVAQIAGALVNIVLDPIMIFGYFGCPEMGISGATYATIIGQMVSFHLDAIFHYGFNKDIDPSPPIYKTKGGDNQRNL
ncbi:polysaccharide biosynthesis C-terminal domain-containing protein [uncultured Robinsoniella sp.]|uniref:MATE family efflux transporter n=1 Tax=uncultured Robinsoniella sp. TaxID=904190 RepID=UPI00374F6D22